MLTVRRLIIVMLLGVATVGLALSMRARQPEAADARTIPTAAGFTLAAAQARTEADAVRIAARISATGLPAFTRADKASYQVVVGPYASFDEVNDAQRRLTRQGFRARLLVDESVRRAAGHEGAPITGGAANVFLIAGAGRLAVVIEFPEKPGYVDAARAGEGVVLIDAGPFERTVETRRWKPPAGAAFLDGVSVGERSHVTGRSLRARISFPPWAHSEVRTSGNRIYVDLGALRVEPLVEPVVAAAKPVEREGPDYRTTVGPVAAKLAAMEPFVLSAAASAEPAVLQALEGSLQGLEEWMRGVKPPPNWQHTHEAIVQASGRTREAMDADFAGNRAEHARGAFSVLAAAQQALTQ